MFELEIKTIVAITQIPILLLLLYNTWQVYYNLGFAPFRGLMYAWFFNLAYVLIEATKFIWIDYGISLDFMDIFIEGFDLICCYFIFSFTRHYVPSNKIYDFFVPHSRKLLSIGYILTFGIIILAYMDSFTNFLNERIQFKHIYLLSQLMYSLIVFNSYLALVFYFKRIKKDFPSTKILFFGAVLYLSIQLNPFFCAFNNNLVSLLTPINYSIGLISKGLIVIGLPILIATKLKELEQSNKKISLIKKEIETLRINVDRVFHELRRPIPYLAEKLSELNSDSKFLLTKKAQSLVTSLESKSQHLLAILTACQKLIATEGKILSFPHLRPGREFSLYNMNSILQTVITITKEEIKNKSKSKITITEEYVKNCYLECNESDMYHLFLNIFTNAYESIMSDPAPKRGQILVKTKNLKESNEILIVISDNGLGITEDDKANIFKEGFTTKVRSKEYGRGHGLNIVKEIVEYYSGRIDYLTEVGNGTEWKIILPKENLF